MKQVLCTRCKQNPAVVFVSRVDDDKSEPIGHCIKCAAEMNIGPVKQMLDRMGISEDDLDKVSDQMNALLGFNSDEDFEEGGAPSMLSLENMLSSMGADNMEEMMNAMMNPDREDTYEVEEAEAEAPTQEGEKRIRRHRKHGTKGQQKRRKFLGLYATDLTQKAREGQMDRIIGRDREVERAIQILCRRSKNNPCLIGEPGVGKTAIAEGLAMRIAEGQVPAKLQDKEIHLLDLTASVAGTQFRGQFESRIKGLIQEVKEEGNIILF
ncbi:MAG TPA: AAA family ATPase, partial [Clostridiales bacterium]|nr:AAA family ATPase [Clostridiales bacterium]